jgi:hypothetical protein
MRGHGLRAQLAEACTQQGCPARELTVLAAQRDPFRLDTPARHRDGRWLAEQLGDRTTHLRGLHYMIVASGTATKPNGESYTNTDADWEWMSEEAAKAARWLGYIAFDRIFDARNSEPVIVVRNGKPLSPYVTVGVEVEIPEANELEPRVGIEGFQGLQPYKLVLFGEKTSLEPVLGPIAEEHKADLYLPSGEISDTLLYRMASVGAADGRHMVVMCFSDCDPSGWQMPISIGRTLQTLLFPDLDFEVRRVGLTPDHIRGYGLPSTPLKEKEKRADNWRAAMGVEQTEIDALAALNPDLLREIALEAMAPFFDYTLTRRVNAARREWLEQAQARLVEQIDQEQLERIRAEAARSWGRCARRSTR